MLYILKTHHHEIKPQLFRLIQPLRMSHAKYYKYRLTKTQVKLWLLERRVQAHEQEVALAVEQCLIESREKIDQFFAQAKLTCGHNLDLLFKNTIYLDDEAVVKQIIDIHKLDRLEHEIEQEMQQKLTELFGMKSVNIAALHPLVIPHIKTDTLAKAIFEYRRTILVARAMLQAGNKAGDKCLNTMNLSWLFKQCFTNVELGTIFLKRVDCHPEDRLAHCQRELSKRVTGILDNFRIRLVTEFDKTIAKTFYQLYDDIYASHYAEQRQDLLIQIARKSAIIPIPSSNTVRQAV